LPEDFEEADPTLVDSEEELALLEIREQAAQVGKLSPREYAKIRGKAPQLVYYHIRKKHIEMETCICGRKVIDVAKADAAFAQSERGRRTE
jgi:hypothetical protein